MALTTLERTVVKYMLRYYSGELPGIPADENKVNLFMDADEAQRRVYIKAFIQTVALPELEHDLAIAQAGIAGMQNKITALTNYINT